MLFTRLPFLREVIKDGTKRERVRKPERRVGFITTEFHLQSNAMCVFPLLLASLFPPASVFASLLLSLYLSLCCHTALWHALSLNFAHCLLSVSDLPSLLNLFSLVRAERTSRTVRWSEV